uniref:EGF-like domain-containing protein n=1 Tax=Denticeps clupeoides TaxID=299321 RepID=A0AAY4EH28_9TELE
MLARMPLVKWVLLLCLSGCSCQRDCTGVDCPALGNCIEEVLESGACCAACARTGCACKGYQYYDCVHAGFQDGKVPEGESYFVDFGSTECSCPAGGGKISCHYILCPEIPANCIKTSEPTDGCVQCERVGCVHQEQKYEAGHSFHMDPCQVCHCPNDGGNLMCYPIPDCNAGNVQKPMLTTTTKENAHGGRHGSLQFSTRSQNPGDNLLKPLRLSENENLPLFTRDHFYDDEDYCPLLSGFASVVQQQCCTGSLKQSRCLAGMGAARGGETCQAPDGQHCGEDSYQCCSCCSLGLKLQRQGHGCDAHQYFDYPCGHILLTCCEEEGPTLPSLRKKERPRPTVMPKKGEKFPKEAFSIEEEREEAANTLEEAKDVDECKRQEGLLCHHTCINTWGSYQCACHPGFELLQDGHSCAPGKGSSAFHSVTGPGHRGPWDIIDSVGSSRCSQKCSVVGGQPKCSCFPGFSLMADGQTCEDVNECRSGTHNCFRGDFCVNRDGSFQCVPFNELCSAGFVHNLNSQCVDVDECITNTHTCQADERCVNTLGAFACERQVMCSQGFQPRNEVCEDIDECVLRTHNCGVGLECQNTEGSFTCKPKPKCFSGFSQDPHGNCIDINECATLSEACRPGFNCINTVGSYTCQRKIIMCSQGHHSSPDGARCIDVDECQTGVHRCGQGQICQNIPGSYRCDCQTGYQYDSLRQTCVDVNECWRYPGRLCAQTCENTPGSYQCSCTAGFSLAFDGKNCEDINECDNNPCSQECANIYGSYQCYCRQGFYLKEDGHACEDIDECSQSIGHLCAFQCVNVPGSYQCTCPPHGYTMSPNGRTCRDIDECATGAHNCSVSETCYNIQGSFRCLSFSCPANYRKVSDTRCERSCPNFLDCQNLPLRITYYQLSFQTNIIIPAQIFRIGPSPAYAGDNIIISITRGNEDGYFSTRRLNSFTGAVYLQRPVREPRDFLIDVEMKLLRQGTFTTFLARIYVFITASSL